MKIGHEKQPPYSVSIYSYATGVPEKNGLFTVFYKVFQKNKGRECRPFFAEEQNIIRRQESEGVLKRQNPEGRKPQPGLFRKITTFFMPFNRLSAVLYGIKTLESAAGNVLSVEHAVKTHVSDDGISVVCSLGNICT